MKRCIRRKVNMKILLKVFQETTCMNLATKYFQAFEGRKRFTNRFLQFDGNLLAL